MLPSRTRAVKRAGSTFTAKTEANANRYRSRPSVLRRTGPLVRLPIRVLASRNNAFPSLWWPANIVRGQVPSTSQTPHGHVMSRIHAGAFDSGLILRRRTTMVLSREIGEHIENEVLRRCFRAFEGKTSSWQVDFDRMKNCFRFNRPNPIFPVNKGMRSDQYVGSHQSKPRPRQHWTTEYE